MKCMILSAAAFLGIAIFANAQQAPMLNAQPALMQASPGDQEQVQAALKLYENAYQHLSLYELQKVWPDLPNQKEYRKIEDLFTRGDVSNMKVAVQIQDIRWSQGDAVARGTRHQEYLKTWHAQYVTGEHSSVGGPKVVDQGNKARRKDDQEVEFTFRRSGDRWVIGSVADIGKPKRVAE